MAAVYPAMAIDPKELTEDWSMALDRLITVLWIPAGIPTWKIRFICSRLIPSRENRIW